MNKTYTTTRGVEVEFLPIPLLLEKLQSQHPQPQPPTYTVKTATGNVEVHPHDETTLETDADRQAWQEYLQQAAAAKRKLDLALMRLIMLRGIKVLTEPAPDWAEEQEFIGIEVPTDPRQRRMHWLETEVFANQTDYMAIVTGVMEASGVPEEVIQDAEATFRGPVEQDSAARVAAAVASEVVDHQPAV